MSRKATYELVLRKAEAYRKASRKERSTMLTQMKEDTGYDRKTLIRLMKRARLYPEELRSSRPLSDGRGRPRKYGPMIRDILWRIVDEASLRTSPIILVESIRTNMDKLIEKGVVPRDPILIKLLMGLSPSTAYRLIKEAESVMGALLRTKPYPKAHKALRARVPYAIATDRDDNPGHLQADSCEHSGGFHEGHYIHSLIITDIRKGWTLLSADLGLSAESFKELISRCLSRYPVKVRTFQTDGGPEFLNHILEDYTRRRGILFIASRPYKSNDQAHVEERHHHVVRAFVGRDRLDTQAELAVLRELYENLEPLLNIFTPTRRGTSKVKTRSGRLRSIYDKPRTPLERLLPHLHEEEARELLRLRDQLNPVDLKREVKRLQGLLGELLMAKKKSGP